MNRFKIRLPARAQRIAFLSLAAVTAALLSGCGAGQISQMAAQQAAVNGNVATIPNKVALRDIRLQAEQNSGDYIQKGRSIDLVAVAVNLSSYDTDKLTQITSDIGQVAISGTPELNPSAILFIGTPDGQHVAPGPLEPNTAVKAVVNLDKDVSSGLLYDFTFVFEKAGQITVKVPIAAGTPSQQG